MVATGVDARLPVWHRRRRDRLEELGELEVRPALRPPGWIPPVQEAGPFDSDGLVRGNQPSTVLVAPRTATTSA